MAIFPQIDFFSKFKTPTISFSTKPVVVETFQPSKVSRRFSIKAKFLWKFAIKAFLVEINERKLFVEISNKVATVLVESFQENRIFFLLEFFNENSATLGGNFATKQREFW